MLKTALAGAMLAMVSFVSVSHDGTSLNVGVSSASAAENVIITEGHIARLRNALRLTSAQMQHWRPVESALRAMARNRSQQSDGNDSGYFQRAKAKVSGYAVSTANAGRLAAAARPLISILDEEQKKNGLAVIRSMGVASML